MQPSAAEKPGLGSKVPENGCALCHGKELHESECPVINSGRRDFRNVDLVRFAMTKGDSEMQKLLRDNLSSRGMDAGRIEHSFLHQRQRTEASEEIGLAVKKRVSERPDPTDEEVNAGVYMEQIEPHVRDAVILMRRKGYDTKGSGFSDFDTEKIYLDEGDRTFTELDGEVKKRLEEMGVKISKDGSAIDFSSAGADMPGLKAKWDSIAELLPDLGRAATNSKPYGGLFRYNAIKAGKLPRDEKFEALWEKNNPKR